MDAGRAVLEWLRERDQARMIETFDGNLVSQFDLHDLQQFGDQGTRHRHAIVHELVKHGKFDVLAHLVLQHGFDINAQRESDLCTPLHLAMWKTKDPTLAQRMIDLGADVTLRNNYGESANDVMGIQAPIRTRLQGARSPSEVLDLVEAELANFDAVDCVTAYYRIAQMLGSYDAEFNTWSRDGHAAHGSQHLEGREGLPSLRQACIRALTDSAAAESGSLWATMMRAEAMHLDRVILDGIDAWARQADLATLFGSWGSVHLWQTSWGMAKIGDAALCGACLPALGSALSGHIPAMQERHPDSL